MRRLLLLLIALLPGWMALRLIAGEPVVAPWLLRDAGLLAALAVSLGGMWALGPYVGGSAAVSTWPGTGRALYGAGLLTALAGAALQRLNVPYAGIVWGVGCLVTLAGAFWRGPILRYAAPAFRWERDAQGRFVRRPADRRNAGDLPLLLSRGQLVAGTAVLLLIGGALRFWLASSLPPFCRTGECDLVLALAEGRGFESLLVSPLSRLLLLFAGDALYALRLAAALGATAGLAALALALHRWVSPAGVLAGLAVAAVAQPFVLPVSDGWVELPLLIALVAWGMGAGLAEGGPRPWAGAGLALGLLAVAAPQLAAAWLAWLLLLALLLAVRRQWRDLGVLAASTVVAAAFSTLRPAGLWAPLRDGPSFELWVSQSAELLRTIALVTQPWLAALVLLGTGASLRARRRGAALLAGAAALLLVLLRSDLAALGMERALLPLAGFGALLVGLGLDQVLRAGARAWGATHARGGMLLAGAWIMIALLALPATWRMARQPASAATASTDGLAMAASEYIRSVGAGAGELAPSILLPPGLIDHPSVRLAAAQQIESGRVASYSPLTGIPWPEAWKGGLVYLVKSVDTAVLDELRRVYPEGSSAPLSTQGDAQLTAYTVDGAALFDSFGLAQYVYAGDAWGSADEAALSVGVGPLQFGWGAAPPLDGPFSVEWTGALLARSAGAYSFSVETPGGSLFSLLLDGQLILDTSAGLSAHSATLPAGIHNLQMRFRSGEGAGDLVLLWQQPGQDGFQPVPREALHNPALPPVGLLGTYTAGAAWDGALLAQRNDRILAADATLPLPWGVVWQGQIAAPRAGEYLIGAVSNGTIFLDVDGQRIASRLPAGGSAADAVAPPPAEGAIFLAQGWHPITIRFAATAPSPEIKLYWQPPGQGPAPLSATELLPVTGDRSLAGEPLPLLEAPDSRFGGKRFALTTDVSYWQPQVRIPPQVLPPLPFERVATAGFCGAEIDALQAPHGLAFDPQRSLLYVADTGNLRVVAYAVDGPQLTSPLLVPFEEMEEPVDVAVTAQGMLYTLDTVAPRLLRHDPATGESQVIGLGEGFYRPRGLAAYASGLIIADTGGARIAFVGENGKLADAVGGQDTPLGRSQPVDAATVGNEVWAIGAEHGRLWQLDTLGSLTAVQPSDTINGSQIAPVVGDEASGFFLSDPARKRVLYLGADGEPRGSLDIAGAFALPTGVAAWRSGDDLFLAVGDTSACQISLWQARAANLLTP